MATRQEHEIESDMVSVARAAFPCITADANIWQLVGQGCAELDALASEAKAARQVPTKTECNRLDREMREYRRCL